MHKARSRCLALLLCVCTLFACLQSASATETEELPSETEVQTEESRKLEAVPEETAEEAAEKDLPPEDADPAEGSPMAGESLEETASGDENAGIMPAASDYSFSTILAASQTTSANNYLNYISGSGKRAVSIHKATVDGTTYWAYCAESRKSWPSSYTNFTQTSVPTSDFYQIQKIVMQLGFGDNNVTRLKELFGYSLNNYEAYQATQIVMWAAQVWERQWSYLAPAPDGVKDGVLNYWNIETPSGKDADAYNFALKLADAVQSIYEDGISCSVTIAQYSTSAASYRYKITVTPKNYFGGYTAGLSGLPSGSSLTSSDGSVTVSGNTAFTSTTENGTDTLYVTIPRTSAAQSLTITAKVTPYVRQYSSNSAVGYLEPANDDYQTILFAAGNLSVMPVSKQLKVSIPRTPTGKVTITKLDEDTQEPVPGVVFELYEYSSSGYVTTGRTAVSNENGLATFDDLEYNAVNHGRYRVYEVSSDTHKVWTDRYVCWFTLESGLWYSYSSAAAEQETGYVTQNPSGSYNYEFQFTAYNKAKVLNGSLTIHKQDEAGNGLSDVSFVVTNEDGTTLFFSQSEDGSYIPDDDGNAEIVTDEKGFIQIQGLPKGNYLITEVKTVPGGYTLLPASFSVTLPYTDDDGTEHLDLTYTVINHPEFTLPATGGQGIGQILFAGLALLAASIILLTKYNNNKGELAL